MSFLFENHLLRKIRTNKQRWIPLKSWKYLTYDTPLFRKACCLATSVYSFRTSWFIEKFHWQLAFQADPESFQHKNGEKYAKYFLQKIRCRCIRSRAIWWKRREWVIICMHELLIDWKFIYNFEWSLFNFSCRHTWTWTRWACCSGISQLESARRRSSRLSRLPTAENEGSGEKYSTF